MKNNFWDNFFIKEAKRISAASKDPSSQVGCIIVCGETYTPITQGFNTFPKETDHSCFTWEKPAKYYTVIHAEMSAVLATTKSLKGAKAFVTDAPCESCLKHMLHAGIREVYYESPRIMKTRGTDDQKQAIKALLLASGATVQNINGTPINEDIE
jgi:dCMP deaminase